MIAKLTAIAIIALLCFLNPFTLNHVRDGMRRILRTENIDNSACEKPIVLPPPAVGSWAKFDSNSTIANEMAEFAINNTFPGDTCYQFQVY